jgi:hypothetical protein
MGKFQDILNKHGFKIKNHQPIKERVYELENSFMAKISYEEAEIKAALRLEGVENENWANVVKVITFNQSKIIITEKLDMLTEEYDKKLEQFFAVNRKIALLCFFLRFITFGSVNIKYSKFEKHYKGGAREWYEFLERVVTQAKELGVEHPSDFMARSNLGMKDGKIACFDIMDEKNKYFEDNFW